MKLDPNLYRQALDCLRPQMLDTRVEDPCRRLSEVSVFNHIPLLAVLLYALRADMLGEVPKIRSQADRIQKSNHYLEVSTWTDV